MLGLTFFPFFFHSLFQFFQETSAQSRINTSDSSFQSIIDLGIGSNREDLLEIISLPALFLVAKMIFGRNEISDILLDLFRNTSRIRDDIWGFLQSCPANRNIILLPRSIRCEKMGELIGESIARNTFIRILSTIRTHIDIAGKDHSMLVLFMPIHLRAVDDIHNKKLSSLPASLEPSTFIGSGQSVLINDIIDLWVLLLNRTRLVSLLVPLSSLYCRNNLIDNVIRIFIASGTNAPELLAIISNNTSNSHRAGGKIIQPRIRGPAYCADNRILIRLQSRIFHVLIILQESTARQPILSLLCFLFLVLSISFEQRIINHVLFLRLTLSLYNKTLCTLTRILNIR